MVEISNLLPQVTAAGFFDVDLHLVPTVSCDILFPLPHLINYHPCYSPWSLPVCTLFSLIARYCVFVFSLSVRHWRILSSSSSSKHRRPDENITKLMKIMPEVLFLILNIDNWSVSIHRLRLVTVFLLCAQQIISKWVMSWLCINDLQSRNVSTHLLLIHYWQPKPLFAVKF